MIGWESASPATPAEWHSELRVRKMVRGGGFTMSAAEQIDGSTAGLAELGRAGIDALVKALGPVGMARFLQQLDPGHGDYTAERDRVIGSPTVDEVMAELERQKKGRH